MNYETNNQQFYNPSHVNDTASKLTSTKKILNKKNKNYLMLFIVLLTLFSKVTSTKPPRLNSWMGDTENIIGNLTLLDISLPGTHDTLTYDLSSTVANNANSLPSWVSSLLHEFHYLDQFVGKFIRKFAITQELNITQQLNSGIRFLDIRTTFTAPQNKNKDYDWYSLHMVESNKRSMEYFTEIANFLRDHPKEIIVMMLTRHGSEQATGNDQYPGASNSEKQKFWQQIKEEFLSAGVGFILSSGVNYSSVNSTSISELISKNKRILLYAGDYENFTNNDTLAWDGNYITNGDAGQNVNNLTNSFVEWDKFYRGNEQQREYFKKSNMVYLVSLAGTTPISVMIKAGEIYFLGKTGKHPHADKYLLEKCAKIVNIKDVTSWCPKTINEWERLRNFYSQVFLDRIVSAKYEDVYSPPGAIYLDVVGINGEIRTDSQESDKRGFGYVDTLLLWNVRRACGKNGNVNGIVSEECLSMDNALVERRKDFPMERWDDISTGRHSKWPENSTSSTELTFLSAEE